MTKIASNLMPSLQNQSRAAVTQKIIQKLWNLQVARHAPLMLDIDQRKLPATEFVPLK